MLLKNRETNPIGPETLRRVSIAAGVVALMVFGMGPTCYNENGAACGTVGALGCSATQIQVCQDQCVSRLGLGPHVSRSPTRTVEQRQVSATPRRGLHA